MPIIQQDNKIRNVKLTGDEIDRIIDELERIPHNVFTFMNYDKIIKALRDAKKEDEFKISYKQIKDALRKLRR